MITVKLDTSGLRKALTKMAEQLPKELQSAVNKSARAARTDFLRSAAKELNLKPRLLNANARGSPRSPLTRIERARDDGRVPLPSVVAPFFRLQKGSRHAPWSTSQLESEAATYASDQEFCRRWTSVDRRRARPRSCNCRGERGNAGSNSRPIIKRSASDKALLREGDPYKLLLVGVDTGKAAVFSALKNTVPGENYIHFPVKYVEGYYRGLTSERERLKIDKRGNVAREFYRFDFKIGNEALDTFVYALAAFHTITPDPDWTEIAHRLRQTQAPKKRETMAETAARLQRATGAQPR